MIKKALISVYDKKNLLPLIKKLLDNGVEIISTGKTYEYLSKNNFKVQKLSEFTNFPEIMGGRVKTLHPKVHGAILADRDKHTQDMRDHDIPGIDLVVSNLYPFEEYVRNNSTEDDIIENIDIGGVTLLRAAAKNFKYVTVLSDPDDYKKFDINCDLDFRKKMAKKAFQATAHYDSCIANWYSKDDKLPSSINISVKKNINFRYGENPHQVAAFYSNNELPFLQLQGKELSYNNLLDTETALNIVNEFTDPTCVIVKHNNPCGVASVKSDIIDAYKEALSADDLSAFGGIISFNCEISVNLAREIVKHFFEVIIAPSVSEEAKTILSAKKNLRVLIDKKQNNTNLQIRTALNGFLVQENDSELFNEYKIVTNRQPISDELEQMIFAWKVCKYVKSNAIVITKNYKTIGIGAGQMSRIKSVEIALEKTKGEENLVMASDAFFPFSDSIEIAAKNGVSCIIQPGGSINDNEVIKAADKHNMAMIFTGMRHFKH
jgi:phosphoribosylaminoimidazolecarboxamide formyltransferase/IMP cyclohydrolase